MHADVQLIPCEDSLSYSAQLDVAFTKCQTDTKALYTSEVRLLLHMTYILVHINCCRLCVIDDDHKAQYLTIEFTCVLPIYVL